MTRPLAYYLAYGAILASTSLSALAADAPKHPVAPASQPADDQTLIQIILVEFTPTSPEVKVRQIRRKLGVPDSRQNPFKALAEIGEAEVLSRPSLLVRWPESATVTIGECVPTVQEIGVPVKDPGLSLSLEGEWLRMDPKRAYLRVGVERLATGKAGSSATTASPHPAGRRIQSERIVTEEQTSWMILKAAPTGPAHGWYLIGLTAYHVHNPCPDHRETR